MWPFFQRNKQAQPDQTNGLTLNAPPAPRRLPMRFADLANDMGGFGDFRDHDSALKFWLPVAANEALEEMADRTGISMSESLRQLFATHCYGIYAYQVMIEAIPGIFRDSELPLFSRGGTPPHHSRG